MCEPDVTQKHGTLVEYLVAVDASLIAPRHVVCADVSHEVGVVADVVGVQRALVVEQGLAPEALKVRGVMIHAVVHENGLQGVLSPAASVAQKQRRVNLQRQRKTHIISPLFWKFLDASLGKAFQIKVAYRIGKKEEKNLSVFL